MAPAQVVQWIRQAYPKPRVNGEWLDACCAWIADEMQLNPDTQTDVFIKNVENQLLESDLRDSMETGTGLPRNAPAMNEIGHSAFNLHNVRQTRIERADLAGLAQEEGVEDYEGPVPNYPHSMLKFEVCDGTVTLPAIEYRALSGLKLDETPLGFKIVLKDVLIRRGVIFLEPQGVVLKGHKTNDKDEFRDRDFVRGLFTRMMKPVPDDEQPANNDDENHPPARGPPPAPPAQAPAVPEQVRSPLRSISEPPEPFADGMDMDDEADLPRKRRIPNPNPNMHQPPPAPSSISSSSASTLVASRFFAGPSSLTAAASTPTHRLTRVLSPVRGDPIDITDSSMEDPEPAPVSRSAIAAGKQPAGTLRSQISYEEFDFDDDDAELDAAFLDEIAKVEKEALLTHTVSQAVSHSHSRSQSRAQSETIKERRTHTPVPIPSSSTAASTSSARPAQAHRPQAQAEPKLLVAQDVITIEDDEDDDKENVPVPKRRVRRRVSAAPDDVIDISD